MVYPKLLRESLLFLLAVRETLILFADEVVPEVHREQVKSFIKNDASDYEVLYLLLNGEFPGEKYNPVVEKFLYDKLFLIFKETEGPLIEAFGFEISGDMEQVDSIYPFFSSAKPILEKQALLFLEKGGNISRNLAYQKIQQKGREELRKKLAAMTPDERKAELKKLGIVLPKKKAPDVPEAIKQIKPKATPTPQPKAPTPKTEPTTGEQIRKFADEIGKKADSATQAVKTFIQNNPEASAVAAGVLVAMALYASFKTYKRFFSKAAKSCKGKKGSEKTICMKNYQIAAYNTQIKDLQAASRACKNTKNPKECVEKINKKVQKIKQKMLKAK